MARKKISAEDLTQGEMLDLLKECASLVPLEGLVDALCASLDKDDREDVAKQLQDFEDPDDEAADLSEDEDEE